MPQVCALAPEEVSKQAHRALEGPPSGAQGGQRGELAQRLVRGGEARQLQPLRTCHGIVRLRTRT